MDKKVYSPFEIHNCAIKFEKDEKADRIGCMGSIEENADMKVVTKKCEGIEETVSSRPTGTGELKMTLHIRWEHYVRIFGMKFEELKPGVYAYGKNSRHEEFCLTGEVSNEYDQKMLKAYPRVMVTDGKAMKVTNGEEEVAEMELTAKFMPDEHGMGTYEAMLEEVQESETLQQEWNENFNAEGLYVPAA
ncbi:MAG: hypothetical protein HFG29_10315 [Eubacterium sp.]|nr:hypothetical protein [Eubacterium sp.]